MKKLLFTICMLAAVQSWAQVSVAPPVYQGSFYTFSGNPTKSTWTQTTLTASAGARWIRIDNSLSTLDTLCFGFKAADTAATKRYKVFPGKTDNHYIKVNTDMTLFFRSFPDSTKPVYINVQ